MTDARTQLVETWITGWARLRGTALPERHRDGFRVEVGAPDQRTRYVFPALSATLTRLAADIELPAIYLKVCAPAATVKSLVPRRWRFDAPRSFMLRDRIEPIATPVPGGYTLEREAVDGVTSVRVRAGDGTVVASGSVIVVDRTAIVDRVETLEEHRRRGLARAVMATLDEAAAADGARRGLLVATAPGRALYETLGWSVLTPYTSIVIPTRRRRAA